MRIDVSLTSDKGIVLPTGFNSLIQGLIYAHINPLDMKKLHDYGFRYENRQFRLFCFSSIREYGRFLKMEKKFHFPSSIHFYISSPVDWIVEQIAKNLISSNSVRIGSQSAIVSSIGVIKKIPIREEKIVVKTLSPIENHSTLMTADGKKKTYYYSPFEDEFSLLTESNLQKKWEAYFQSACPYRFSIRPLFNNNRNERILYFGNDKNKTIIKGWVGRFELSGDPQLLTFSIDTGLGSRNSQGFGMVEPLHYTKPQHGENNV